MRRELIWRRRCSERVMSSELTIDIQLTELGFSNWDFQLLEEKEKHQTPELTSDVSSCPDPVETYVDACPNSPSDHGSEIDVSSVESSKTSGRETDKGVEESSSKTGREEKKHNEQRSLKRKLMSDTDACEEEEEEEDEDEDEDEEGSDIVSSDTNDLDENQCPVCNLTFTTTSLLHEHLNVHDGVQLYTCAECGKSFCHLQNYRTHLRSHATLEDIQCIICRALFATQEHLQQHLDTNHFEDKFYQCDFCKRIFTNMDNCRRHVRMHKRHPRRHPCPKCEQSFRHPSALFYHLRQHKKGLFVCKDCGMMFPKKVTLLRHSFKHLDLPAYTCLRCKRHFRLSKAYRNHECKPEQLQCVACLVVFQSKDDFEEHKKSTGCWGYQTSASKKTNDIRCMECGEVFDSSEELKKHAGTHQRVMRCSECGMGFRSSIMLMSHMGGHAAQRPCLCKECGLGFCHQQAYDSHLKTCGTVTPAVAATKKQRTVSNPERNELASTSTGNNSTDKSADPPEAPQCAQLHPGSSTASQTKPGGAWTLTLNKKAGSPLPLVMFLPVPSTSAKGSVPNPQNHVPEVSETSLSSADASEIPLNPTMTTEPAKPEQLQDNTSSIPATKLLIPLTMKVSSKLRWAMSDQAASHSLTGTKVAKNEQTASDVDLKPALDIPQDTTETKDRNADLPSVKTEASAIPERPLSLVKVKIEPMEEYLEQGRSVLEDFDSKDSKLMMGVGRKIIDSDDFGSSETKPDISRIKKEPKQWDEDPKSYIHSLPDLPVKTEESFKGEMMHKAVKAAEDQDLGRSSLGMERFEGKDVVQCETCGEMLLETEFEQHSKEH